jgi:hypothetical protein
MQCGALPMPLASDDAEIIPKLSSPGMLSDESVMTDGCHGAAGITVIDSRLMLIRPPVAVLASGCLSACTPLRPAGGQQPTSVSAQDLALSWHIVAGPHAWRHGSRPSPSAQAGQELNAARGCCASRGLREELL